LAINSREHKEVVKRYRPDKHIASAHRLPLMLILICLYSFVASRGLPPRPHLTTIGVGSWVAVEPNGTELPFMFGSLRLRAELPSPKQSRGYRQDQSLQI
jgi:hypothetical protein